MKRQVPKMTTDEEAEAFLDQDLSDLDFSQFKPVKFQIVERPVHVRMSKTSEQRSYYPAGGFLRPGTPAPRSGIYEQRGPRGGRTGIEADSFRGKPLPPAPKGRTWTLVEPGRHQSGAKKPSRRGGKDR